MVNRSHREPQRNSESSHKMGILSGLCITFVVDICCYASDVMNS